MFYVVLSQPNRYADDVDGAEDLERKFERESAARKTFWAFVNMQSDDGEDSSCSETHGCCLDLRYGEDKVHGLWQVTLHSESTYQNGIYEGTR